MELTSALPDGQPTKRNNPPCADHKPFLKTTAAPPAQVASAGQSIHEAAVSVYPASGLIEYVPA